jgi:hypothetical protein
MRRHAGDNTCMGVKYPTSYKQNPLSPGYPTTHPLEMKKLILLLALAAFANCALCQAKTKKPVTRQDTSVDTTTAFKMRYDDLFTRNSDNTISPVRQLMINGEMVPTSTKIAGGVTYGGVDLSAYAGHDMLVDTARGLVIIRKFLK